MKTHVFSIPDSKPFKVSSGTTAVIPGYDQEWCIHEGMWCPYCGHNRFWRHTASRGEVDTLTVDGFKKMPFDNEHAEHESQYICISCHTRFHLTLCRPKEVTDHAIKNLTEGLGI